MRAEKFVADVNADWYIQSRGLFRQPTRGNIVNTMSRKSLEVENLPDIVYGTPSVPLQFGNIADILRVKRVLLRGLEIQKSVLELQRRKLEIHHFDRSDGYFEIEIPKHNRVAYDQITLKIAQTDADISNAQQAISCVKAEMRYTNR